MFKRIVVPLDGSPLSEMILAPVASLARGPGAEVFLLRVGMPAGWPASTQTEEVRAAQEAEAYLTSVGTRLARDGVRTVRTIVRYGRAAPEIVDHVVAQGADLVAMCTHGRSGWSRLVLGSVAEEVVRKVLVFVIAAYWWAYRVYSTTIDRTVIRADPAKATPAKLYNDGVDFMPASASVRSGFSSSPSPP